MRARAQAALEVATNLGMNIFCPTIYQHVIFERNNGYDCNSLYLMTTKGAEGVILYKLPGYEKDLGVKKVLEMAAALEIPVQMMEPYPHHMQGNYAEVWQTL
jgi:hypothetical protein